MFRELPLDINFNEHIEKEQEWLNKYYEERV